MLFVLWGCVKSLLMPLQAAKYSLHTWNDTTTIPTSKELHIVIRELLPGLWIADQWDWSKNTFSRRNNSFKVFHL
jgi:hypothetical protein